MEFSEKRRSERVDIHVRVELLLPSGRRDPIEAITADMSGTGMRIRTHTSIEERKTLTSRIYFPGEVEPLTVPCRVVRVEPVTDGARGCFYIACEYAKMFSRMKERFVMLFCAAAVNYAVGGLTPSMVK